MITYLITNTKTGDTYIGRTKLTLRKRMNRHFSSAKNGCGMGKLQVQIRKYNVSDFEATILCEGNREKEFIEKLNPTLNMPPTKNYIKAAEANSKPIMCVETGEIYGSSTEAERLLGINAKAISNNLRGKSKTCGGFHWTYLNS